jgi:PAS domain S-box-containing protein
MDTDQSVEILRLRATVRDLLALSIIPETWVGREPFAIATDLIDLLVESLQLDFAFVRLCDPTGCQVVEVTRGNSWKTFPEWLQQHLTVFGQISRKEIVTNVNGVEESCCGIVIPVGVDSKRGLVAAACDRSDFPDQIDQQLLSVAANNAATAFQNARLINELRTAQKALREQEQELRRAHDELEIKVAGRTSDLRKSERELREVIDTIPAAVWSALPDGSNTYVNKRFVEYSGLSAEQAAGSSWQAATHPDDLQQHLSKWMASVATGELFANEVRFRRADGQYRWHLCRGVPLRDDEGRIVRWYGILFDIDELKKAESALQVREHELLGIIETIPSMLWSVSPTGETTHLSQRLVEYCGVPLEELVNRGWERFIHPDDREETLKAFVRAMETGESYSAIHRLRRADGQYRWHQSRGEPLRDPHGKIIQWYGLAIDIDERKRAEHERERLLQMEADLAHVNRVSTLGEMAASLAHEIKQPIAAAITSANSCIEWLAHEPPNLDRARAAAARIDKYGNRAAEVIDRIRSLYKKSPPQRELVDMNGIIQEMLTLLKGEANRYPIAMRTELAAELPEIRADRVQLQQVFMNLMLNAIEAMKDSGGELTVESVLQDGQLQFSVSDTGVGLPMEKMDQIFSAFFTTKPQGSGMGLSISRSIVESHGGRLWATANDGRGATFHFTLPIQMTETSSQVNPVMLE